VTALPAFWLHEYQTRLSVTSPSLYKISYFILFLPEDALHVSDAMSNRDIEVNTLPCANAVLHHSRFLHLIQTCVSHMLLASGLYGSPSLTYTDFPALTRNAVHATDFQT